MSEANKPIGSIGWTDLTVPEADKIRDFYQQVVGWTHQAVSMGEYDDYVMKTADGAGVVGGICHARGSNASIPPQWMMYITVEDVDQCATTCKAQGGKVLDGPREMGKQRFCVIQDPAGAVAALITPEP